MSRTSTPTSRSTTASWSPTRTERRDAGDATLRVLGVDPGTIATGWGLVGGSRGRPVLIECGRLRLGRPGDPLAGRLLRLRRELEALVERLRPAATAVESPFHGKSARAALQLAHARGVILAVLAGRGLEVCEFTPATVKKTATGSGRASKQQVRRMVARLLGPQAAGAPTDATDALAVALCRVAVGAPRGGVAAAGGAGRRGAGGWEALLRRRGLAVRE